MTDPLSAQRQRVAALSGMDRLLPALAGLDPAYLVGGAVRDLLMGNRAVDLDLVVEGDAPSMGRVLAERLGGRVVEHDRFATATVSAPGLSVDLATARRERYPVPGALPSVEPASLTDDLLRRDFTINAMAVGLSGDDLGRLHDPRSGYWDLKERAIRVLHVSSFLDDPTRILRGLRYEARLGFRMDVDTEALARQAIVQGALATVSGSRLRDGLLALLAEPLFASALERMRELELDRALHPALGVDPELAAAASLAAGETGADRVLAALSALVARAPDPLVRWLDDLNLPAAARDRVRRAALQGPALAAALSPGLSRATLHELMHGAPSEVLALALALGAPAEPVLRYTSDVRDAALEISGDDLIGAGVPESPAVGRALRETLRRKLEGEVSGREEELRAALAIARSER